MCARTDGNIRRTMKSPGENQRQYKKLRTIIKNKRLIGSSLN
jgi:hypothetical protein